MNEIDDLRQRLYAFLDFWEERQVSLKRAAEAAAHQTPSEATYQPHQSLNNHLNQSLNNQLGNQAPPLAQHRASNQFGNLDPRYCPHCGAPWDWKSR